MGKLLQFPTAPRRRDPHAARNARVEQYINIVRPIASGIHKHRPPSFDVEDLEAIGHLALVGAADSYDDSLGVPFEAYAKMKVRGAILDATRRKAYRDATHEELQDWHVEMRDQRPNAEEAMVASSKVRTIRECVDRLPTHMQAVIISRYEDGETLGTIARRRGVGYSHGITELHRSALREVKNNLADRGIGAREPMPRTPCEIIEFVRRAA